MPGGVGGATPYRRPLSRSIKIGSMRNVVIFERTGYITSSLEGTCSATRSHFVSCFAGNIGSASLTGSLSILVTIPRTSDPIAEGERNVIRGALMSPDTLTGTDTSAPPSTDPRTGIIPTILLTVFMGATSAVMSRVSSCRST